MKKFNDFTKVYSLSKTLRFELIPIAGTKEAIAKSGIIEQDRHRDIVYEEAKDIIDRYHKYFIDSVLDDFCLTYANEGQNDSLEEFYTCYMCGLKEDAQKKLFEKIQGKLRKQIADAFANDSRFKNLNNNKLIKEVLVNWGLSSGERDIIDLFKNFTTYFSNFFTNRKNMYTDKVSPSAIAHRLVNENLPLFIDNINIFDKIAVSPVAESFAEIYSNFEEYLNVLDIPEMFTLGYYNNVLTQKQIDVYNLIIGGKSLDDGSKIKGLNEYINIYNNECKNDKSKRLPKLKPLYKQILSDKEPVSWLSEQFTSDNELLAAVKKAYQELDNNVFNKKVPSERSLKELLLSLGEYDLEKIYINNEYLTTISQRTTGNYGVFTKCLVEETKRALTQKKNETDDSYNERCTKKVKSQKSFSIAEINNSVATHNAESKVLLQDYFSNLDAINNENKQKKDVFTQIEEAYSAAEDLLTSTYPEKKKLVQDRASIEKIKTLMDAIKALQRFVKPLLGSGTEADKDEKFYGEFILLWDKLKIFSNLYDMVRNWITSKPYNTKKIKLHFENNGSILNGWVDSKTENSDNGTQYGGYIFRKKNSIDEYDYFIGVSADTKLFRNEACCATNLLGCYERLNYYQIKSKTIYGAAYKGNYSEESANIIESILSFLERNYSIAVINEIKGSSKEITAKGLLNNVRAHLGNESIEKLLDDEKFDIANKKLTQSLQKTLASFVRVAGAVSLAQKEYTLFSDLMVDVEQLCNEKIFTYYKIDSQEINDALKAEKKRLYLFKISNKDLSFAESYSNGKRKRRGKENLHTMFFKELMSGNQTVFDLGAAAIYFRERSINISKEVEEKGHHYEMLKDRFGYPIISNKRYCYDKFLLHLSIVQNYQLKECDVYALNRMVRDFVKESDDVRVLGIDRGERNLLYATIIDLKGNIIKQCSLNEIDKDNNSSVDYHKLLTKREDEMDKARDSWNKIEKIKDLKEGYLSAVIHKLAELIVEYNAIVVLEDLNPGFMRGRLKVESSVYQKFEKMLIDKLNYLVDKNRQPQEPGGVLNAYQLTPKYEDVGEADKQCGFLFYIPAWNTSKIDPVTGFANMFSIHYTSREAAKEFFGKFDSIRYNSEKDYFEFEFDYAEFTKKAEGTRTHWTVCTCGKRLENYRDEKQNSNWSCRAVDITEDIKNLFAKNNISLGADLKNDILKQDGAEFFKELIRLFKLTLQMRNSRPGGSEDYLHSPVADENGVFYNSNECDESLPLNADANGAYNIARKGLWIVRQIKASNDWDKLRLAISNKEWLNFAQTKPYLND